MRPDELERRIRERLDALGPAPRAELLHVLMLPDFERADRSESSGLPGEPRLRGAPDRLRRGPDAPSGAGRHAAGAPTVTARAPSPQVGGLASIPARSEDGEVALFKQLPRRVSVLVVVRRALLFMLASLWAIPFLPMPAARSQTTVSGRIEQDTAWTQDSSPFVLIGQVVVVADVTLTIEPGVQVRGTVGSSLVVNGALNAVGTEGQRIIFTSDSGQQDWSGIHVAASVESSPSPSALRFVTIERATRGIKWGLTRSRVEFSDNQLDGNGIALVFDNPIGGTVVQRSVLTNNGTAVTGTTRGRVGIYEK